MPRTAPYAGPALLSHGFRLFFLGAVLFGTGVVPAWLLVWRGEIRLAGPLLPLDWHIHEMIFGYAAAVIAGFLFTAVPNWTGRMPIRGWPLLVLAALWLSGRLAVAGALPLGWRGVAVLDSAFLLAIALLILVEILAGRNWRNLKVAVPVLLLFAANATFHIEAATQGAAEIGRRLGLALVIFLIALIGGRIVPSFTRNWLVQRGSSKLPLPFGRFDAAGLMVTALALAIWTARPEGLAAAVAMTLAGALQFFRLARWRGALTWRAPLLAMLHLAYLFLALGLVAAGLGAAGLVPAAVGVHLLGIGAVGGMTAAVMTRATRGHTGRDLVAGPALTLAFALIGLAALARVVLATSDLGGIDGITWAALAWGLGFAILALRLAPWLASPAVARRQPQPRPPG